MLSFYVDLGQDHQKLDDQRDEHLDAREYGHVSADDGGRWLRGEAGLVQDRAVRSQYDGNERPGNVI
jgi:hypothetical protein